ncbi:hypothetical protein B5M50_05650 [candidate division KSB1 bacterium 4484_219]|nr:MAG: hypothetical protein B5M50_05650 [candidate division KSB1 bacterium 4484_219]
MYKIAYMNCVVTFCVSILLILGIFWLGTSLPVWAQEYIIGADDVLNVTFWQQPDLNSTVKVGQDGKIELPVIGSIQAAGLTPSQLSRRIAERISLFNTKITQASVVVVQYGSKKIYVTGHVLNPGKYTFESIPNLWELILEAGGPAETAILSNIKIIRGSAEGKKSIVVDLTKFLEKGNISELPKLYPGDTVYIPGVTGAVAGAAGGSPLAPRNVVYIFGQIANPGAYTYEDRLTLLQAIVTAGGMTPEAATDRVKIYMEGSVYPVVATVNLKNLEKNNTIMPFYLHKGDTIYVPSRTSTWSRSIGAVAATVFRYSIAPLISVIVYNAIR